MKYFLLLFSLLFFNSSSNELNFITFHTTAKENENADFRWSLKIINLKSNYIEFEILDQNKLNNGLLEILDSFEQKVNYDDFIEYKNEKTICRLKTIATKEHRVGQYFIANSYRDKNEVFFSTKTFYSTTRLITTFYNDKLKLSGLNSSGFSINRKANITYTILLNEEDYNKYLMKNNISSLEKRINSIITSEFRSIVSSSKEKNPINDFIQYEINKKLQIELNKIVRISIILTD
ncbi:hypothetical protein [Aurantibacter sp.]|uniref:hypothetical protein n=1 Tax=Aurantibacter sp. TaxID=2807103 RepID=UPI0035C86A73